MLMAEDPVQSEPFSAKFPETRNNTGNFKHFAENSRATLPPEIHTRANPSGPPPRSCIEKLKAEFSGMRVNDITAARIADFMTGFTTRFAVPRS
jgi:hypothetical protein